MGDILNATKYVANNNQLQYMIFKVNWWITIRPDQLVHPMFSETLGRILGGTETQVG